jgi:hypothetical protein
MHYTPFFSVNSVVTVIMSSGDYFLKIYDMVITRHYFSVQIQSWLWLCHPETTFENIWYGHHQASFFGVNSVMTVIMSSGDYFFKIYNMVIIRHHFLVWIQLWQWLCHLETTFWKYIIWSSPGIIFQCKFSHDHDYVIRWYGHHQASFFSGNSVMTVIMLSRDYFLKIYDMVITMHHFLVWIQSWQWLCHLETTFWKYMIWSSPDIIFQCEFSCNSDCVIWRLCFDDIWYGHHQASFVISHLAAVVVMSSGDDILVMSSRVVTVIYTPPQVLVHSTGTVWSPSQPLWSPHDFEVSVWTPHKNCNVLLLFNIGHVIYVPDWFFDVVSMTLSIW